VKTLAVNYGPIKILSPTSVWVTDFKLLSKNALVKSIFTVLTQNVLSVLTIVYDDNKYTVMVIRFRSNI
jgi:hypothetical protein